MAGQGDLADYAVDKHQEAHNLSKFRFSYIHVDHTSKGVLFSYLDKQTWEAVYN